MSNNIGRNIITASAVSGKAQKSTSAAANDPKEKFMNDRIIHAVTRFQAIWRGFKSWKIPPRAIVQKEVRRMKKKRAEEACNNVLLRRLSESSGRFFRGVSSVVDYWERLLELADKGYYLKSDRPKATCRGTWKVPPASSEPTNPAILSWCKRDNLHEDRIGTNSQILFNRGEETEVIYSCEIVKFSEESGGLQVYVRFHFDLEPRKYYWKRFLQLEMECHIFMKERGMLLIKFEGKIATRNLFPTLKQIEIAK